MYSPRNYVSLGNNILAQVQLINKTCEKYHVNSCNNLNLEICENIIKWFIPKSVFVSNEDHVYFKINLISNDSCLLKLKKHITDENELSIVIHEGRGSLRSWGEEGGDFCIVNPKSEVSHLLSKHNNDGVTSLIITTYKKRGYCRCKRGRTVCDGGPSTSRIQFDGGSSEAHFATFGDSSQTFHQVWFEENEESAIETIFKFIIVN